MEKEIKILELFGGIGALTQAFKRQNIPHKVVDYVEIDKYAVKSYNAMNGTNFEPQDICTWDKDVEVDLIMHGSPCQDFSLAGLQKSADYTLDENGNMVGNGTRSSLMYETIRIVKKIKPKYVIWENVKNLLSKKHVHNFNAYLETMEHLGYTNYYQILNAKDYGIPQNRERVFTISILGDKKYEFPKGNIQECEVINPLKGISGKSWQFEQNVYSEDSILRSLKAGGGSGNIPKIIEHFKFPLKQELKLKLKDMLEDEVDEKYYLSEEKINKIAHWKAYQKPFERVLGKNSIVPTLTARGAGEEHSGMITYCDKLEDTTNLQEDCMKIGLFDDTSSDNFAKGKRDYGYKDEYGTLKCNPKYSIYKSTDLRIRKITPREAWRLMGFSDQMFERASSSGNSNTQLYKQAGNSIVVNVLEAILINLFM